MNPSLQPATQKTIAQEARCAGIGVHSGEQVSIKIMPAAEDQGITFIRTDLVNGARTIPARWDHVVDTKLCTVIGNDHNGRVATIEHLMAAIHATGIDNATIEIDGAEVPVMDGSSDAFVTMIEETGLKEQKALRRTLHILKPVEVIDGNKIARLLPYEEARYSVGIEFSQEIIKKQHVDFILTPGAFKHQIARARTFGFFEEIDALRKMGLGKGGSLENAVVIKDNKILNEEGLRFDNEFVRHKLLDAIGDLALAGNPIKGHFQGERTGHAMNNQLLRALFADSEAWMLS